MEWKCGKDRRTHRCARSKPKRETDSSNATCPHKDGPVKRWFKIWTRSKAKFKCKTNERVRANTKKRRRRLYDSEWSSHEVKA